MKWVEGLQDARSLGWTRPVQGRRCLQRRLPCEPAGSQSWTLCGVHAGGEGRGAHREDPDPPVQGKQAEGELCPGPAWPRRTTLTVPRPRTDLTLCSVAVLGDPPPVHLPQLKEESAGQL